MQRIAKKQIEEVPTPTIRFSHLADSGASHEAYYLHMPGTVTGKDYSDAANTFRKNSTKEAHK